MKPRRSPLSRRQRQHNAFAALLIGRGRDPADAADLAADVIAHAYGEPNKRTAANDA